MPAPSPVSYIKHGRSLQKPSSSGMDGSPYLRRFQSNKPDACLFASMIGFRCRPMSTDTNNNRQADVRFRIASIMQAEEQARRKEVTQEDVRTLRAAACRLDQMLKEIAEAEEARCVETLRAAACRLDRLLAGITGKAAMPELKLRRSRKGTTE